MREFFGPGKRCTKLSDPRPTLASTRSRESCKALGGVLTIYETPTFVAEAAKLWSTEERLEFFQWIAGELCMLLVYPKSARDAIHGHVLRTIRKELEDGIEQEG